MFFRISDSALGQRRLTKLKIRKKISKKLSIEVSRVSFTRRSLQFLCSSASNSLYSVAWKGCSIFHRVVGLQTSFTEGSSRVKNGTGGGGGEEKGRGNHPGFCIARRKCASWYTICVGGEVHKGARLRSLRGMHSRAEAQRSEPTAISSRRDKFRDIFRRWKLMFP